MMELRRIVRIVDQVRMVGKTKMELLVKRKMVVYKLRVKSMLLHTL